MRQETVEKFLKTMYPEGEFQVINYEKMPKFDFNDSGHFVEVNPAIFIDMKISNLSINNYELVVMLQKFTGFEFSITRI